MVAFNLHSYLRLFKNGLYFDFNPINYPALIPDLRVFDFPAFIQATAVTFYVSCSFQVCTNCSPTRSIIFWYWWYLYGLHYTLCLSHTAMPSAHVSCSHPFDDRRPLIFTAIDHRVQCGEQLAARGQHLAPIKQSWSEEQIWARMNTTPSCHFLITAKQGAHFPSAYVLCEEALFVSLCHCALSICSSHELMSVLGSASLGLHRSAQLPRYEQVTLILLGWAWVSI